MDGVSVFDVDGSSTNKTGTGHANVGIDEDVPVCERSGRFSGPMASAWHASTS